MKKKQEQILNLSINLAIILAPVFFIMQLLIIGAVDETTLARWDIAISIGAIISVTLLLFKNKKK